jgi:hypothetical protein
VAAAAWWCDKDPSPLEDDPDIVRSTEALCRSADPTTTTLVIRPTSQENSTRFYLEAMFILVERGCFHSATGEDSVLYLSRSLLLISHGFTMIDRIHVRFMREQLGVLMMMAFKCIQSDRLPDSCVVRSSTVILLYFVFFIRVPRMF